MNSNLHTLFDDLMALCAVNEAFYFVEQMRDGKTYRTFTYRLASFTDFQNRNALECRGHTFRNDGGKQWTLVSLPPQKFFNYSEHVGWGTEIDMGSITAVMDKLDGSLISTVMLCDQYAQFDPTAPNFFLKSKTSFTSSQAVAATEWLDCPENVAFRHAVASAVNAGWTVNFEWLSSDNQIVIGYQKEALKVLNVRHLVTGKYWENDAVVDFFGKENVVESYPIPDDPAAFLASVEQMTGVEGVVVCFGDTWVKQKTDAYCILHKLKDSINNERRLWEACVNETADDLRALFVDDPVSIAKIIDMEEKAAKVYNHADKVIHAFYDENKELDRKSFAIKGQVELVKDGLFSLAMNLYLGKSLNLKDFLVKNYKKYGIKDEETDA